MMKQLRDMKTSPKAFSEGLQENALRHFQYNMYTSMERAMALLLTGKLYLSNGQRWNDTKDREFMKQNLSYGVCLSCTKIENIAMWMLYSGDQGKKGAMISITPSIMKDILSSSSIEVGNIDEKTGSFVCTKTISIANDDYQILLTDVVYTENLKDKSKLRITVNDDHEIIPGSFIDIPFVFSKNYAWSYEKECRLIVCIKDQKLYQANSMIRITLNEKARNTLAKRITKSPLYSGVDFGKNSKLQGEIEW